MRNRLIVLGAREETPPTHPEPSHFSMKSRNLNLFSDELKATVTCGDALADLPEVQSGHTATEYDKDPRTEYQQRMRLGAELVHNHQASKHRQATMDYYGLIPAGGTALDIPKELRNGKQGVQRWPLDGVARTITTEPTDFLHPTLDRIPTIRELARIQSFPDRFRFLGQRTTGNKMRRLGYCSQSQQVGNAVPPILAEAVGRAVIDHWR